jgi:methionyl-tRNA synthetase
VTNQKFYITTAISYPNGKPHIGHAYEAICTDAIARFHRLMGHDVMFLTGTDEHGLKMEQTARKEGVETRVLADRNSALFRDMCKSLNISNDRFIRTTDEDHKAMCQWLWQRMEAAGDIYLDRYEGWYSVRDEAYYDETELTEGEGGVKLAPTGTPVEWTVEESYFFRLSKYADKLLELYEKQPEFIRPEGRRNEIMSFVKSGLRDLSISRTSFKWGVPVPGDDRHVMYVWVDALTNYLTAIGWPNGDKAHYWPADVHIIGKDIVRFHTVYWPAFLMSAGVPLPKQVFGHGFLLSRGGEKLSKSAGNATDLTSLVNLVGADAVRYYCLRKVSFGDDGGYSLEDIIQTYNSDLANTFGNLVQRVFSFISKNLEGRVPMKGSEFQYRRRIRSVLSEKDRGIDGVAIPNEIASFENYSVQLGLSASGLITSLRTLDLWQAHASIMIGVFEANKYIDAAAPWSLKKTNPQQMEACLSVLLDGIRTLAILFQVSIPSSAARVLAMFGPEAFDPKHVIPAKAGIPGSVEHSLDGGPGFRRGDEGGESDEQDGFAVSFDAINDHDWYDRWQKSGFTIQPPTPIFPRLEMPKEEA